MGVKQQKGETMYVIKKGQQSFKTEEECPNCGVSLTDGRCGQCGYPDKGDNDE